MGKLQPYSAEKFNGGAVSYAAQGICSICHTFPAEWMKLRGAVLVAYCDECARFISPCTCRIAASLPDGRYVLGGIDDCPIHGIIS